MQRGLKPHRRKVLERHVRGDPGGAGAGEVRVDGGADRLGSGGKRDVQFHDLPGFRRQFGQDLGLRPPHHALAFQQGGQFLHVRGPGEVPDGPHGLAGAGVPLDDLQKAVAVPLAVVDPGPRQAHGVKHGVEVHGAVDDRGAGQEKPLLRGEGEALPRALRVRVLEVVRLVENEEVDLGQGVFGGHHRLVGHNLDRRRAEGQPDFQFPRPVQAEGSRADDPHAFRAGPVDDLGDLDGLAETRLVGQEYVPAKLHNSFDPFNLVGPQSVGLHCRSTVF